MYGGRLISQNSEFCDIFSSNVITTFRQWG